jgi:hypothetical protein
MNGGLFSRRRIRQAKKTLRTSQSDISLRRNWSFVDVGFGIVLVLFLGYAITISTSLTQIPQRDIASAAREGPARRPKDRALKDKTADGAKPKQKALSPAMTYKDWRDVALNLAKLPSAQVLLALKTKDPFGMRTFEKRLLERESQKGAVLNSKELRELFPCPKDRITLPDQRNHTKGDSFRSNTPGYFLFFQHLRKAGGTNFCTLAEANLPPSAVGQYYCMSDYEWFREVGKQMAGYLHHWTNDEIARRMAQSGHRVTGNEWDNFDRTHHIDLPAIFATSFRRPLDRALSQFRFECVENRGCKFTDVGKWWKYRRDLYNVYSLTFADVGRAGIVQTFEDNSITYQEKRAQLVADALDTVAKFHLVLIMEWLAYAKSQVEDVLGFSNTESLTRRVRPLIGQAKRDDGQEVNTLGAAGITKASWAPEEYLTSEQYKDFSEHLALDEIMMDAARRMFLERLVCDDLKR